MDELNQKIYEKAIQLLSIRLHTTGELQQKLAKRGFASNEIIPILKRLEELKFLDDERFAQIFVDNLKRYKDFGYYGIKAKLLKARIPSNIAERALSEFFTAEDEIVVAKRLVSKLKRQGREDWKKLTASLANRGFRADATREATSSL
ncbi:MAG: RecX family transcriptional regulator [bacterium]|nr:RecX family transcriptional regulator [bacterium]